jgi:hypothetical protein
VWLRALLFTLIMLVGFLVRWVYLTRVPAFTDEMDDVLYSLPILMGGAVPLTNLDTFNGGLYTGLIAGALWLLNLDWTAPRLVSWLAGGFAVGASYALGRATGGHAVGLMSATMMALAPAHILINSHVAWSHSLTPLFTTGALALLTMAATRRWALAPAGILAGLALQSHASTIALLPGALPTLWAARRFPNGGRWLLAAALFMCLIEAPVIYYNVTSGFESFKYAAQHRRTEDRAEPLTPIRYTANLGLMLEGLSETLGGSLTDRDQTTMPTNPITNIAGYSIAALGLAGLIITKRWLLLGCSLTFVAILPVLNSRFLPTVMNARYVMPLVPLALTGAALLLKRLYTLRSNVLPRAVLAGLAAVLLVIPLWGLTRYVSSAEERQLTTAAPLEVSAVLRSRGAERVILDENLNSIPTLGGGRVLKSDMVLLALRSMSYQIASPTGLLEILEPDQPRYALLTNATVNGLRAQPDRVTLERIPATGLDGMAIYRLRGLLPHEPTTCVRGVIRSWAKRADETNEVVLDTPRNLLIDSQARSASVSLRELDRFERPIGQSLEVCTPTASLSSEEGPIQIRAAHQITFLPLRITSH